MVRLFAATFAAAVMFAVPAWSSTITSTFVGTVTDVSWFGPLAGFTGVHNGDTLTTTATYDTAAVDINPGNPSSGDYPGISLGISFSSGFSVTMTDVSIRFSNDIAGTDQFGIVANGTFGDTTHGFSMVFEDPTQLALSSDALLSPLPLASLFASSNFFYRIDLNDPVNGFGRDTLTGTFSTPVPAALPLFASALGGLGFIGWRRSKSAA
jgi:hypothetical protein